MIVATQLITAVVTVLQLFALRLLISSIEADPPEATTLAIVLLTLTTAISGIAAVATRELRLAANEVVEREVTLRSLQAAANSSLSEFEDDVFHDLMRRATQRISQRVWSAVWASIGAISNALTAAGLAVAVVVLAPTVFAVALLSAVPIIAVSAKNSRTLHSFTYGYTAEDRRRLALERMIAESRTAAEMRDLGFAPTVLDRIGHLFDDRALRIRAITNLRLRWSIAASTAGALVGSLALLVLARQISADELNLADGLVALIALQQLTARVRNIAALSGDLDEAALYLRDFDEFVARAAPPTSRDTANQDAPFAPGQDVTANGISFRYSEQRGWALSDVSFELPSGQIVAIVGENGSGKSTLAKLLAGLYEPAVGHFSRAGTKVDAVSLAGSTSMMFQDFARFPLSLFDNVTAGRQPPDRESFEATLAEIGLEEFVAGLPNADATILSNEFTDGTQLSGGQWQRIALARAIHQRSSVLILDEPSTALDAKAEAALLETLRSATDGKTVVFISHRFNTVRHADQILVLNEGRLVESGTHDELMGTGGLYSELFRLQADNYT